MPACEVGIILMPILQMRKLSLTEVWQLDQGHTASEGQSLDSASNLPSDTKQAAISAQCHAFHGPQVLRGGGPPVWGKFRKAS